MLDWDKYIKVANRFQYKARREDREDLNHNIVLALAQAQASLDGNGGGELSYFGMLRIASYECEKYWRKMLKLGAIISINGEVADGEGDTIELYQLLADDKAVETDKWLDAKSWLYRCPDRLVRIAYKKVAGYPLSTRDRNYLYQQRRKQKESLVLI